MRKQLSSVFALLFALASPFAVQAAIETSEPEVYVVCKNRKVVRTIRIEKGAEGGCQAKYTKAGVDRVVGYGSHPASCTPFLKNVQSNLEEAHWQCREVKGALTMAAEPGEE